MQPTLALQELLRTHGPPGAEALSLKMRRHQRYPNLICFKYHQRLSPMHEEAVQDARGIILDEAQNWAVVSMAFRKFFNLGETLAAPLDWHTARVEEKLDGSLMCLYFYGGAWQVQSSGTPDASGMVVQDIRHQHAALTYRDLFWQTWRALGYALPPTPQELGAAYTFAFELMTPENRVVVRHDRPRLVLHGVRHLGTLEEQEAQDWARRLKCEGVQTFDLTQSGLRGAARRIPAHEGEGFVVRDAAWRRVKVKSEQYVRVSLIRESWSERRALDLLMLGEADEFLAYFPEYGAAITTIRDRVRAFTDQIDHAYAQIREEADQKAFALRATPFPFAPALFALRQGRAESGAAWFASLNETQRLRALEQAGVILA